MNLSLKIQKDGITKTIAVPSDYSVHELTKEVKDKFELKEKNADHGIFFKDQGKWLINNKILDFYDLKSGDLLEYKKKHRPLKFRTLDNSIKTCIVDQTLPVNQLVELVCARIGITNAEEYSFQPDIQESTEGDKAKPKSNKKNQKLTGQIADDARWLNPDKTLAEQGVEDTDIVILNKKFFFTDQNIDRNDPVQLNLMYEQAKLAILSGKHPCTTTEAAQFAANQMQIKHGNHEPDKHKIGFIKTSEYLPPEYRKNKEVEKEIYSNHRKLHGLSDLNSKFRYVQLSRSLKTYGITFFLVKERVGKKNKLESALLGVTKSTVVKLDLETKDILTTWKLTQLRRWAASPGSFTLDFGDYSDAYYSVQTDEGEQISQLIAGYIDIILKKRKETEKEVPEDEMEESMVEEFIKPQKAQNFVGSVSNGYRIANEVKLPQTGSLSQPVISPFNGQYTDQQPRSGYDVIFEKEPEYLSQQKALGIAVRSAMFMLKNAVNDLNTSSPLPPLGNDPASLAWKEQTIDVNTSNIQAQLASELTAAASMMNRLSGIPDQMEFETIGTNIGALCSNVAQMAPAIKLIAALMEDGDDLMDVMLSLLQAISNLINAAEQVAMGDVLKRQDLHRFGKELAVITQSLLMKMERAEVAEHDQSDLLSLANQVVKAVGDLVSKARIVSKSIDDAEVQRNIVLDAKFCFDVSHNLYTAVAVVNPTVNVQQCVDQVMEGSVMMKDAMMMLTNSCKDAPEQDGFDSFMDAGHRVEEALARLVTGAMNAGKDKTLEGSELDQCYDVVLAVADRMLDSPSEMEIIIKNTKELTLAATQFVAALKRAATAAQFDDDRTRLLNAAKGLADATSKMVGTAKDSARAPTDLSKTASLKANIESLKKASANAGGPSIRARAFGKLAKAIKDVIASSKQLTAASKSASSSNKNQSSQLELNKKSKKVGETLPQMISALKSYQIFPSNIISQTKLVISGKAALIPGHSCVSSARTAAPYVGDIVPQSQLVATTKAEEDALIALEKILKVIDIFNEDLQMENALLSIKFLQQEMISTSQNSEGVSITASEGGQQDLFTVAASIQSTINQIAESAAKGNEKEAGVVAFDAVLALQALSFAVQGYSADEDCDFRDQLMNATSGVGDTLCALITAAKNMVETGVYNADFVALALDASRAIGDVVECLPGQKEIGDAIVNINQIVDDLATQPIAINPEPKTEVEIKETKVELQKSANRMSMAANNLLSTSLGGTSEVHADAEKFVEDFKLMAEQSISLAQQLDEDAMAKLMELLQGVGSTSSLLLQSSKGLSAEKDNFDFRTQLMNSARSISDAMENILGICAASSVGQADCSHALQSIAEMNTKLESVNEVGSNKENYAYCLTKLAEKSKLLIGGVSSISNLARSGDMEKLTKQVKDVSEFVGSIIDVGSLAAYLVGVSDPSSTPATEGPIDRDVIFKTGDNIKVACENVKNPQNSQKEILSEASSIAKHTSALCSLCKTIGQNPSLSSGSRSEFVNAAKDLAVKVSNLVASIKTLALAQTDENRAKYAETVVPLITTIDALNNLANSKEFSGSPAKLTNEGIEAQKPIIETQKKLIASSEKMVFVVKSLCSDPTSEDLLAELALSVRGITDSLQGVVKIATKSNPGFKECEATIHAVRETVSLLDQAIVEANINCLEPKPEVEKDSVVDSIKAFASLIDVVSKATQFDSLQLGLSIADFSNVFHQVIVSSIASASHCIDLNIQKSILDASKEAADNVSDFLSSVKGALGSSLKQAELFKKVEALKLKSQISLTELKTFLEGSSVDTKELGKIIDRIEALNFVSINNISETPTESYRVYAGQLENFGKQLVDAIGDILLKARTTEQYRLQGIKLAELCEGACAVALFASSTTANMSVKHSVVTSFRETCSCVVKLVDAMRLACGKSSADQVSRSKLTQAARVVSISVAGMITSAKEGSKVLLICQEAMSSINDIIADIEGVIIFADAGQLDPHDQNDEFSLHKENMLKVVSELTAQVNKFVTAVTGSQEELAANSIAAFNALNSLKEFVKSGATSISSADKHMQQHLLMAYKNTCETLQSLIATSINASGKNQNDPSMKEFVVACTAKFNSINELVRITNLITDESTRGVRAIDVALEEIENNVAILESSEPALGTALPDEVATMAKLLAAAAASLVAVSARDGGKQDDLVASANLIRKQVNDICRAGKAVCENAPSEIRLSMIESVSNSCKQMEKLLKLTKESRQSTDSQSFRPQIQIAAKSVSLAVSSIVGASSNLIPAGYVDPNDPDIIAEKDLLNAAASIEAAAKKLSLLKPVENVGKAMDDLGFEGQIFDAAKAIAMATSSLVRSATNVQREIASSGKRESADKMYFNDGTWNEGLVSSAKQVASATMELCESANSATKGSMRRERVIVAAKGVSASTVALLSAAMVRSNPNSQHQTRLKAAGKAVTNATSQLVKASEESTAFDETDNLSSVLSENLSSTSVKVMEMEAQMSILKMEKDLVKAREKLAAVRKGKYSGSRTHTKKTEGKV